MHKYRHAHMYSMIGVYVGALLIAGAFILLPRRFLHEVVFGWDFSLNANQESEITPPVFSLRPLVVYFKYVQLAAFGDGNVAARQTGYGTKISGCNCNISITIQLIGDRLTSYTAT